MKNNYKLLIILGIIIAIIILFEIIYKNNNKEYNFKIHFFNAGKADAMIVSIDDKYMMKETGEESLSDEILRYFKNNNITKLEYLIITHFDKDHVGSASKIIDNIEIGSVLQSNYPKDSDYYTNYLTSLENKNITPTTISKDYNISLNNLDITVNGPTKIYDSNESNNSSLIVSIKYNNNSFLFMGDSQNARIKDFIENNTEKYDFLKVPYHGNYQKRLDNLLENTSPKYGVLTCSNTEGCEEETIKLLNNYNVKYYLTKNGSITVLSNGNKIKINQ